MTEAIAYLVSKSHAIERVVVSCSLMQERVAKWGVPGRKVVRIPLGVDVRAFRPASGRERSEARRRWGVPEGSTCIASFQKDGVGWGEGIEPKLIKGPDIFLAAVRRIAQVHPVFVLLTGPARGYVKRGLQEAGIPFYHEYLTDFQRLPSFFHATDVYLVTSREEGGPKAVLESMAAGVPLVSTRVGMAIDIVDDTANGLLADVDDVDAIAQAAIRIIDEPEVRSRLIDNGLATAHRFDWTSIGTQYWEKVYRPVLASPQD